jgi:hypothetical protein
LSNYENTALLFIKGTMKILLFQIVFMMVISCKESVDVNLGENLRIITSASMNHLVIVDENNVVKVNRHILDYNFDSTFIIVAQRPWDSVPELNTMEYYQSHRAFKNSTFKQYWIINKKEKGDFLSDTLTKRGHYTNVYGPFKKNEYLLMRQNLGVPQELKLSN